MDLYTLGETKCALYAVIPDNDNSFNHTVDGGGPPYIPFGPLRFWDLCLSGSSPW